MGFYPGLRTPRLLTTHARAGTGLRTLAQTHAAIIGLLPAQSLISCDITSHVAPRVRYGYLLQVIRVNTQAVQHSLEFGLVGRVTDRCALAVPDPEPDSWLVHDLIDEPASMRRTPGPVHRHGYDATGHLPSGKARCSACVVAISGTSARVGPSWPRAAGAVRGRAAHPVEPIVRLRPRRACRT